MLRQAPAWMGQNLILLVEERMLDGCLDESTKARTTSIAGEARSIAAAGRG